MMQTNALWRFLSDTASGQLLLAETIIFVIAFVWTLLTGALFSTTLMIIGAAIIVFRFLGNVKPSQVANADADNTGRALLKIPPFLIGLIPLVGGIAFAFIE